MKTGHTHKIRILFGIVLAFCFFSEGYSQVGINTDDPQTTLDIRGVNHNGAVTANDGVLVPRVNSLATAGSQNGQLVFLIADVGGKKKGFYFWNGTNWSPFSKNSSPSATSNVVEPDVAILGAPGPVSSFSTTGTTPINNNNAFDRTIAVSGIAGLTTLVTIRINITHTWDGDLDIFLGDPNGNWLELTTDNGGTGENFTNTVFADDGPTNITSGNAPFTGRFQPEGSLDPSGSPVDRTGTITTFAGFNGANPNGTWILRIGDDAGLDTGTFNSATLSISGSLPVNWVSLGEVVVKYLDQTAVIVQSSYSADPLDNSAVKTALTRSIATVAPGTTVATLPGTVLNYSSTAPGNSGNFWVNISNMARDVGLTNNTTYFYQLWRQGNIETPLASNETFTLVPMRIQQ